MPSLCNIKRFLEIVATVATVILVAIEKLERA